MEFREAESIAIATAIPSKEATFILDAKDVNVSLTPSKTSENCSLILLLFLSNIFTKDSLTVSNNLEAFFAATYIPLPAKPANKSPIEILPVRYENTFVAIFQISVSASPATVLTISSTSPNVCILLIAGLIKSTKSLRPFESLSDINFPKSSMDELLLSSVKKSPTFAVASNNIFPRDASPPDPTNF